MLDELLLPYYAKFVSIRNLISFTKVPPWCKSQTIEILELVLRGVCDGVL